MSNVVEFKNKDQQFEEWWKDVFETNFKGKSAPPSAIIIWEHVNEDGTSQAYSAHYNCKLREWEWFLRGMDDKVREMLFDKWIRDHLDEYIEYLNGQ